MEIDVWPGMTEDDIGSQPHGSNNVGNTNSMTTQKKSTGSMDSVSGSGRSSSFPSSSDIPLEKKSQPDNLPKSGSSGNMSSSSSTSTIDNQSQQHRNASTYSPDQDKNDSSVTSSHKKNISARYTGMMHSSRRSAGRATATLEAVQKEPQTTPTRNATHQYHHQEEQQMEQKMKSIDINTYDIHERRNIQNRMDHYQQQPSSSSSYSDDKTTVTNTTDITTTTTSTTEPNATEHQVIVSYAEMKGISNISDLPSGVDPLNREASLSDDEFYLVFDMDKQSFYKLPTWKRTNLKKAKLLF